VSDSNNNFPVAIDFEKGDGLVPAIVQDYKTSKVLMLGFMNKDSYEKTLQDKLVTFFSRSKQRLWTKGETSGNHLVLKEVLLDCDGDTLLIKVEPRGPVCHTGNDTCFAEINKQSLLFLNHLQKVIKDRRFNPTEKSYTTSLFEKGINKIAQKVGEEAVELVIESKDSNDDLFKNEAADLIFHLMVLLEQKNMSLNEIVAVLEERHK
jgi:phosphoribosyl-AMP cyclohydrolase / phosphoribosyl-ATP pyrophosphohydrolase